MLGKLRSGIEQADAAIRGMAAERAFAARQRQMGGIREDLSARMNAASPQVEGVAAEVAQTLGGSPEDYMKQLTARGKKAEMGREVLYQQTAAASKPGMVAQLNDLLAGTGAGARATQVGVYGGIGVGGGLGLTAAGQQLMNLMAYLQQGQETDVKRDQELV